MKDWDDKTLFNKVREGNQDALSILFLRHYDYLLHYGLQQGSKHILVEECIQDVFIHLFESFDRFAEIHLVRAYLFKSLRGRIYAATKKEARSRRMVKNAPHHLEMQFSAEDLIIEGERQKWLRGRLLSALNNLPARQREAIYLRYYGGLSTSEIAEIMGTANQTVLNTLHHALMKLRRQPDLKEI